MKVPRPARSTDHPDLSNSFNNIKVVERDVNNIYELLTLAADYDYSELSNAAPRINFNCYCDRIEMKNNPVVERGLSYVHILRGICFDMQVTKLKVYIQCSSIIKVVGDINSTEEKVHDRKVLFEYDSDDTPIKRLDFSVPLNLKLFPYYELVIQYHSPLIDSTKTDSDQEINRLLRARVNGDYFIKNQDLENSVRGQVLAIKPILTFWDGSIYDRNVVKLTVLN